jgi:hypothetical protein
MCVSVCKQCYTLADGIDVIAGCASFWGLVGISLLPFVASCVVPSKLSSACAAVICDCEGGAGCYPGQLWQHIGYATTVPQPHIAIQCNKLSQRPCNGVRRLSSCRLFTCVWLCEPERLVDSVQTVLCCAQVDALLAGPTQHAFVHEASGSLYTTEMPAHICKALVIVALKVCSTLVAKHYECVSDNVTVTGSRAWVDLPQAAASSCGAWILHRSTLYRLRQPPSAAAGCI